MSTGLRLMFAARRGAAERIGEVIAAAFAAVLLTLALAGCSDAPGKEAAEAPPNPLLYELAAADGTVEGWMIGTIHALPPGTDWRTPAIDRVVTDADLLVVEIAALEQRGAIAEAFTRAATSPGLPPLNERVAPELRADLAALMDRGGLDERRFATTESWAAALTLAQVYAEGDPEYGVDRALIRDFARRPVRELEGAATQFAIFDRLPEGDQRDLLESVITGAGEAGTQARDLRQAWINGDAAAIEAATLTGILADPELRAALLVERNRRWTDAIVPLLARPERPLIAVGAAHLVGPDGLAALLTARGFAVRRLP